MTTAEKIQQHRKRLGLSQEELGNMLNLSRQTVSQWENGLTLPSVDNLIRMKSIFGTTVDELLENDEDKEDEAPAENTEPAGEAYTFSYRKEEIKKLNNKLFRKWFLKKLLIIPLFIPFCFANFYVRDASGNTQQFSLSMFFIAFLLIYIIILAGMCNISRKNNKQSLQILPVSMYDYSFFYDYFIIRITRNGEQVRQQKIYYNEIQKITIVDNYILIAAGCTMLLRKNELAEDGFFLRFASNSQKTKDISKKTNIHRTVSIILFILTFVSLFASMFFVAFLSKGSLNPVKYTWIMYLFIPIPLASIIYGIILKKKGIRSLKNIIAGAIISVLLIIYGSFCFIFSANTYSQNDDLYLQAQQIAEINFPQYEEIATQDWTKGTQNVSRGYIYTVSTTKLHYGETWLFRRKIVKDDRCISKIPSDIVGITSPLCENVKNAYIMIYNKDTGEFNTLPEKSGTYRFLNVIMYSETEKMVIVDYEISYVK